MSALARTLAPRPVAAAPRRCVRAAADADSRINKTVDLGNPKVVHTVDAATIDKQAVYCRCWRSKTFPLCDGAHVEHNKACPGGDNVGPLIVKAP